MIGTTLGPYKIIEKLGAGGMGEVYLAEDTRLGRKVAIKVLPAEFASDPERLARFEQEARAAAALNHPHIAVVHDIGTEAGDDGAVIHFMVQECLEGDTLREPLKKGALAVKTALGLATEIAEALAAAHAAGIVHRDLKPENIFITKEGHAKVLDFGLAKLVESAPAMSPGADASKSPTMLGTVAGQVMGTAGYMAPEQVHGAGDIDHRADVFAFGCVLYEMLSGRQPFSGKNVIQTLDRIVNEEPVSIGEVNSDVPAESQRIVRKCLAKEPVGRYQGADDLVVDLRALRADVESSRALPVGGNSPPTPGAAEASRGASWTLVAAIAAATGLLAGSWVWNTIPSPPEALITRFHIDYPPETALRSTTTLGVAISHDGKSVVFNAERRLWLRTMHDPVPVLIRGTEQARVPFFSPDDQQVGFWADGQIKRVSITGGAPVSLGSADRVSGASWAEDGYIYFGQGPAGILRVSENGGEPEVVVETAEGEHAHGPQLLPGGEWLLFTLRSGSNSWDDASLVARSISGGERKPLLADGIDGRYAPSGHLVYSLDSSLFAVPFDVDGMAVTGGSVSIVEGVQSRGAAIQYAFSSRGDLVYRAGFASGDRQLTWVDREGVTDPLPFAPRPFGEIRLSPDETRIALDVAGEDGFDIWIYDLESRGQLVLTDGGDNRHPVWSVDGEWIFYHVGDQVWRVRADKSVAPELVAENAGAPRSMSPDNSTLTIVPSIGPTGWDMKMLDLEQGQVEDLLVTRHNEMQHRFSPDGRFVVYVSNETGESRIYVLELSSRRRVPVSPGRGGSAAIWSQDGTEIFYRLDNSIYAASVTMEPEFRRAADPVELFQYPAGSTNYYDVTADGQRFLMGFAVTDVGEQGVAARERVQVVLNWFEELKERVPGGGG